MPDDRYTSRPGPYHATDRSPGALVTTLLNDFNDLMRKEIALAKGELSQNISDKVMGSVWMVVAGVIFLVAFLTLVFGFIFLIAEAGIEMHWSAFIVTAVLAVIGAIILFAGRSKMSGSTLPERSMTQVKEDVRVVKEQIQ